MQWSIDKSPENSTTMKSSKTRVRDSPAKNFETGRELKSSKREEKDEMK